MKISEILLDGLFIKKDVTEFGKDDNKQQYNYFKMLAGEDVLLIKIPKDKGQELDSLSMYSPLKVFVEIDLESESDNFSKYIAKFSLSSVVPFNDKLKK